MSANCDERVVRIRQRAVFSAIVGSDIPSAVVELSAAASSHASALTSTPGRHWWKLSDGSYGVGSSCTTTRSSSWASEPT